MDIKQSIFTALGQSDFFVEAYLADLTAEELLARPAPGANHIAWQLGHLIHSERYLVEAAVPGRTNPLPAGFAERHTRQTAGSDDPSAFLPKDEYLRHAAAVRAETRRAIEGLAPADFDRPMGKGVPPFLKTVGETLLFVGGHWLLHAGQWVVLRRRVGKSGLF